MLLCCLVLYIGVAIRLGCGYEVLSGASDVLGLRVFQLLDGIMMGMSWWHCDERFLLWCA